MAHRRLVTRKEALENGLKRYFTGEPCKRAHISERYVLGYGCCSCHAENLIELRLEHPERSREYNRKHKRAKAIRMKAEGRKRPYYKETVKKWRAANVEKERASRGRYRTKHPEYSYYHCASRKARKISATPPWLTKEHKQHMKSNYALAQQLTRLTGESWQVDHIIPLRHERLCGLHVPWNLRVITGKDNASKRHTIVTANGLYA